VRIDNSMFSAYMKCGQLYFERYEAPNDELVQIQKGLALGGSGNEDHSASNPASKGIQLIRESEAIGFGTRMHQLLHERRLVRLGLQPSRPDWCDELRGHPTGHLQSQAGEFLLGPEAPEEIEAECQATFAAYEAHWIQDLEYLESERTHTIPLRRACPQCNGRGESRPDLGTDQQTCQECHFRFTQHQLIVKLDAVVRYPDGTIGPFDTKTESRPGYNGREDWAGKTQGRLYLWALKSLYPDERVSRLTVDVITRSSPKMRRGPVFTRIDDISSPQGALEEAIRNVNYVADRIEQHRRTNWWPANMNQCKVGWQRCDFFDIHVNGRTLQNLRKYRPAENYLSLEE
jgi:hypothetical protein